MVTVVHVASHRGGDADLQSVVHPLHPSVVRGSSASPVRHVRARPKAKQMIAAEVNKLARKSREVCMCAP